LPASQPEVPTAAAGVVAAETASTKCQEDAAEAGERERARALILLPRLADRAAARTDDDPESAA
jgi:spore germination cell wall hydrolase CwlJ-like protein